MTWAQVADDAIAAYELNPDGGAHATAYILRAIAYRSGWNDPRVATYLAELYALRNPDGGWGINEAWDAFQNGTTNPDTTTYTITLADHVGPVLLDAYAEALVPESDIETIVDLLMSTHVTTYTQSGRCYAYSRNANDKAVTVGCVHNVNAAAAGFLWDCRQSGFDVPGLPARVAQVTKCVTNAWSWQNTWWPYNGSGANADIDHVGAQVEFMWTLTPAVAYEVGKKILTEGQTDNAMAPIARMRLAGLCDEFGFLAASYLTEAAAFVATPPSSRALAQAALWAARNAA